MKMLCVVTIVILIIGWNAGSCSGENTTAETPNNTSLSATTSTTNMTTNNQTEASTATVHQTETTTVSEAPNTTIAETTIDSAGAGGEEKTVSKVNAAGVTLGIILGVIVLLGLLFLIRRRGRRRKVSGRQALYDRIDEGAKLI